MGIALFMFSSQNENYKLQKLQANFDSSQEINELDIEFQKVESSPLNPLLETIQLLKKTSNLTLN